MYSQLPSSILQQLLLIFCWTTIAQIIPAADETPLAKTSKATSTGAHRVFISPIRHRNDLAEDVVLEVSVVDLPITSSSATNKPQPVLSPKSKEEKPEKISLGELSLFKSSPLLAAAICALVFVLILATIIGNCMVCLAVLLVRKLKQQPANLLLVSLAVADFCVGFLVMPVALFNILEDKWILGEIVCRLWTTADLTLCTASILNLCIISVDRYLAVTRALRYSATSTRKKMFGYIAIVWIGAFLVSIAPLIVLPLKVVEETCQVSQNQLYQIYATIISFYGPCLIMVIVYVQMWRAAKRLQKRDRMAMRWSLALSPVVEDPTSPSKEKKKLTKDSKASSKISLTPGTPAMTNRERLLSHLQSTGKKLQHKNSSPLLTSQSAAATTATVAAVIQSPLKKFQRPSALFHAMRMPLLHSRQNQEKGEDKARKTLGVIMSVFIICWVPFFILALVKSQYIIYVPKWLDMLVLWLGYSNSMLNPLIYCKYNREFRVPFREMLCCRFSTIQVVMRNESFHTTFGAPRLVGDIKGNCNNNTGEFMNTHHHLPHLFNNKIKRNSSPCTIDYLKGPTARSFTNPS